MTRLLVDTSVLIKWFHSHGESEVPQARALRTAHVNGQLDAHVLDWAYYELGSVLIRALGWTAQDVADQLDDLTTILGPPLVITAPWLRQAAEFAHAHALSFYDAAWAAAAHELGVPLVSAPGASKFRAVNIRTHSPDRETTLLHVPSALKDVLACSTVGRRCRLIDAGQTRAHDQAAIRDVCRGRVPILCRCGVTLEVGRQSPEEFRAESNAA